MTLSNPLNNFNPRFILNVAPIRRNPFFIKNGRKRTGGADINSMMTGILALSSFAFKRIFTKADTSPKMYAYFNPLSAASFLGDVTTAKPTKRTAIPAYSWSCKRSLKNTNAITGIQKSLVRDMMDESESCAWECIFMYAYVEKTSTKPSPKSKESDFTSVFNSKLTSAQIPKKTTLKKLWIHATAVESSPLLRIYRETK